MIYAFWFIGKQVNHIVTKKSSTATPFPGSPFNKRLDYIWNLNIIL